MVITVLAWSPSSSVELLGEEVKKVLVVESESGGLVIMVWVLVLTLKDFYGSRHGKGPSDGAVAVVKSGARRAVMGMNVVINNAEDLYNFGKEKLESTEEKTDHLHHKRTFFLIENIDRNRPDRSKTKTVPGTRKLQCIKLLSRQKKSILS
uniref:Uncharacterized protein n=1 Tax=Magallana gigas TaxID=29159 RepID=A0A8W8NTU4_MAGGI